MECNTTNNLLNIYDLLTILTERIGSKCVLTISKCDMPPLQMIQINAKAKVRSDTVANSCVFTLKDLRSLCERSVQNKLEEFVTTTKKLFRNDCVDCVYRSLCTSNYKDGDGC